MAHGLTLAPSAPAGCEFVSDAKDPGSHVYFLLLMACAGTVSSVGCSCGLDAALSGQHCVLPH